MGLSEGIRRLGFQRWYERQLLESHLYFITGLLSLIAVLACLEGLNFSMPLWESAVRTFAIAGGSVVCLWAMHRYLHMLGFAQFAAARSVCERCETYGRIEVSARAQRHAAAADGAARPEPVGVRCRTCGHEWVIG